MPGVKSQDGQAAEPHILLIVSFVAVPERCIEVALFDHPPGEVFRDVPTPQYAVSIKDCDPGAVEVLEVQREGKRRMDAADFLNGADPDGDVLGGEAP